MSLEPSISSEVPWDRAELGGRECQSCACYFESVNAEDPSRFQGFCRRQPAQIIQSRGQEPRLDPVTKKPITKNGAPVMNSVMITGFVFHPTQRLGTCFDGYRPKGTLPGDPQLLGALKPLLLQLLEASGALLKVDLKEDLRRLLTIPPNGSA